MDHEMSFYKRSMMKDYFNKRNVQKYERLKKEPPDFHMFFFAGITNCTDCQQMNAYPTRLANHLQVYIRAFVRVGWLEQWGQRSFVYFRRRRTFCQDRNDYFKRVDLYFTDKNYTSIAHRIKDPLLRTSEHCAIVYFQTFT